MDLRLLSGVVEHFGRGGEGLFGHCFEVFVIMNRVKDGRCNKSGEYGWRKEGKKKEATVTGG